MSTTAAQTATTMTKIATKDLPAATSANDKKILGRDDSKGLQQIDYNLLAKSIIEQYASSSIAGKNQSLQAAINSLNSGLTKYSTCNYVFYKQPVVTFSSSHTEDYHDITITNSKGHPIYLCICGDNNPLADGSSQLNIQIERGGTKLTYQICQSNVKSQNIPFSLSYIDPQPAGTHSYRFHIILGGGIVSLQERQIRSSPFNAWLGNYNNFNLKYYIKQQFSGYH